MAELVVSPIMEKIIDACSDYLKDFSKDCLKDYHKDYLKDQFRWQSGMKEELERLRENHPKIQAVVFAANQAQLNDNNGDLNNWIWHLRDAIDEADDVLDELKYMNQEYIYDETKKRKFLPSFLFEIPRKFFKIGERALKMDPNLKRLEEAVQKLDRVSADVTTFLHLLDNAKQEQKEQKVDFYRTRETGYLPKNGLIGRLREKELVMEWLRNPSNEHRGTDLYRNISLLSIVGHGGMGKTTLLQHVYKDEITREFDLKMWVCVSNNFDVKKVIADMLESLKKERPRSETLVALQGRLEEEVMSRKFLLVLDDIWEEDEEKDKSKWEDVLAPLASGSFGSKILVTTRMDSVALMFAKVINKEEEIVKFKENEGLLGQNSISSNLRLSYIVLPKHLQNCFAFCCMSPQNHTFDKGDLIRMWIALGFIQPSQGMTMEDIGGRYFDVLVEKTFFEKVRGLYKMQDLIYESASKFFAQECGKLVTDEESSLKIPETIRHLSIQTKNLSILRKIQKFKHLRSVFLFYEDFNQDLCSALIEIFKALRCLRLLYIRTHKLEMMPEEIRYLKHLRYLKIQNVLSLHGTRLRELPKLPPSLKHLSILGCHPDLFERYREDGGSDRHKIAHIPQIHISTE
ncbi:putative disease resistance protein RGA4 [Dendrobium catenatum]|nr:putative disease resistance protein RGA4 [Dendrobium catenatum]